MTDSFIKRTAAAALALLLAASITACAATITACGKKQATPVFASAAPSQPELSAPAGDYGKILTADGGEPLSADLDGDGSGETISVVGGADGSGVTVSITGADGAVFEDILPEVSGASTVIADLDPNDGLTDVIVSYSAGAQAGETAIYRYDGKSLTLWSCEWGSFARAENGVLTLSSSANVIVPVTLEADYVCDPAEDMLTRSGDYRIVSEANVKLAAKMPVMTSAGEKTLSKGTKLTLTRTDLYSYIRFLADGEECWINVSFGGDGLLILLSDGTSAGADGFFDM